MSEFTSPVLVMDKETAEKITGNYGNYKALLPIQIDKDTFYLPESVLNEKAFESVFDILQKLEVRKLTVNYNWKAQEKRTETAHKLETIEK